MKRSVKSIATLMAVVVLAGIMSAFSLGVSAQTEPVMSIDMCNLSFRSNICVKFAVTSDSTAETIILVWDAPRTEYTYGTHSEELKTVGNSEIEGNMYKIYDLTSLYAKQMTDVIYARPYTKIGDTEYYGDVVKYSILQYAYNMLGKTDTATTNENLKNLLTSMLEYGAMTQICLDYKTDRLATDDFYQVIIKGGLIDDMCAHGLYLEGDTVNISAPAVNDEDVAFAGWTNSNGDVVAETANATITVGNSNDVYTAVYGEIPSDPEKPEASVGLEYESNGDGTCYLIGMGDCGDTDVVIPEISPDGDTVFAIDRNAFADEAITSITIPTTIEEIGRNAFNGCDSLTDVYYLGTEREWEALCENVATGNTALLNANVHFAKDSVTYDGPTIVVESVTAGAGDTVDVVVSVANNPGLKALTLSISHDSSLTLTAINDGTVFESGYTPMHSLAAKNMMWYRMDEGPVTDGTVAVLKFTVSDSAAVGTYPVSVFYEDGDIMSNQQTTVEFDIIAGAVVVE